MLNAPNVQEWIAAIGWIYLAFAAIAIAVALWLPEKWWLKTAAAAVVLAGFAYAPVTTYFEIKEQAAAARAKRDAAVALFNERCKSAGEKIYKTAENVEGILILKIPLGDGKYDDPNWPEAALTGESSGDEYLNNFLFIEYWHPKNTYQRGERGEIIDPDPVRDGKSLKGYKFVEMFDEAGGKHYRYSLNPNFYGVRGEKRLIKTISNGPVPRYGVTFESIADPEGRKSWIAGAVIKIIDTNTKEVVAEQTRYLFDPGLGSTGGQRSPWGWAGTYGQRCGFEKPKVRYFVDQVAKQREGE